MAVSMERAAQIQMEETIGRRKRTPDKTDEERELRRLLARDIRKLRRAGLEVVVPNEEPILP